MLLILSDIHLTDGSTAVNVHPDSFRNILGPEVLSKVIVPSPSGRLREIPVKEINIVLLGDIFDLVRTDYWFSINRNERPWYGILDIATAMNKHRSVEGHYIEVLNRIFTCETPMIFIDALNNIRMNSPVPVRITYVIGNHDRAFGNFASLRNLVTNKLNAYRPDEILFTNEFASDQHSSICRHGHEYDDSNFGWRLYKVMNNDECIDRFDQKIYKVQTIGEVITAELLSGMIFRLKNEFGSNNKFVEMMKDVNNVRPISKALMWMNWKTSSTAGNNKTCREFMLNTFKDSLKSVLETDLAKAWDCIETDFLFSSSGDITDKLSHLADLIENTNFDNMQRLISAFECFSNMYHRFIPDTDDQLEGAKTELALGFNDNKQFLFMGHTHEALQAYFSAKENNFVKMYINTGTYLPLIQMTLDGMSFAATQQMTLAFVYTAEELRSTHPSCDLWNGIRM